MSTKDLSIGFLFDFYGELLSDRQKNMFDLYYNEDLSLAEIAEQVGITRQGVRDTVKKVEEQLLSFEDKLGLATRFREISKKCDLVTKKLEKIKDSHSELTEEIEILTDEIRNISEL